MKTSDNITVTDGRLKKALQTNVENIIIPQINSKVNKTARDAKIQVATMTKFYPYLDKCEVDLNGNLVICKILHRFSGALIDFYTPIGDEDYCERLKEPCIIPMETLQCLILDINDDSDEQLMIGYFLPDEIVGLNPASQGNLKLASMGETNQYWIKFGIEGLDIRSPDIPSTNIGEYDSDMVNLDYVTKKELDDLIIGEIADLSEIKERLDELEEKIADTSQKYQYQIEASDYNPSIDSTVTITVKVTDQSDNIIPNHSFNLNANGTNVSLTTDSAGVATYNYTCSNWGVCRFSIKTYTSFINVGNPYPVGSIYISVNATNPSLLFGGTWQQLEDTFLFATSGTADTGYQATGGSANAVLVKHNHSVNRDYVLTTDGRGVSRISSAGQTGTKVSNLLQSPDAIYRNPIKDNGEDGAGKNMPPYMKVYMWKRTA